MVVAREIIRAGADILIGSHSHAHQPSEICFVNGYEEQYMNEAGLAALEPATGCVIDDPSLRPRKALILYSLGNFATTMGTFLGQTGSLHRIPVFTTADGVDFGAPSHELVYNEKKFPPDNEHRLMLLKSWIDAGCYTDSGECPAEIHVQRAFLEAHLF